MFRAASFPVLAVAISLLVPAGAGAAKNGTYIGKDAGQEKVVLKIKSNRVTYFEGNPAGSCYGTPFLLVAFRYPSAAQRPSANSAIKARGVFSAVFKGSPDVSFNDDQRVLAGRVSGDKVTGRMLVSGLCQVDQKFTAKRK